LSGPLEANDQSPPPARGRRFAINEDWAATILGLALLLVVLAGLVPEGVIP